MGSKIEFLIENLSNSVPEEVAKSVDNFFSDSAVTDEDLEQVFYDSQFYSKITLSLWIRIITILSNQNRLITFCDEIRFAFTAWNPQVREDIRNVCFSLIIHSKGDVRFIGRILLDYYKINKDHFNLKELCINQQIRFLVSLTQDFQSPETRIPLILEFFNSPYKEVREALLQRLSEYSLNYLGYIKDLFNNSKFLESEETEIYKKYLISSSNRFQAMLSAKELHSDFCLPQVYEIANRTQQLREQTIVNEYHHNSFPLFQLCRHIEAGRGGGFIGDDGIIQSFVKISSSQMIPMMMSSLTPLESLRESEWSFREWPKEDQ